MCNVNCNVRMANSPPPPNSRRLFQVIKTKQWSNVFPIICLLHMAESKPSPFRYPTSLSRLFAHIHLFFHIKASLEGTGSFSHTGTKIPDQEGQLIPEFEQYSPSDPAALCDLLHELARHLRSRLPGCKWFEEGAIEFDSDCPADAGEVANIFAGTMGDRKVLVKCYRFYPSTDYLPSYMVRMLSDLWVCRVYPKYIGRGSTQKHWPAVVTRTRASCHLSAYTLPPGIRCVLSSSTCTTQT